MQAPGSPDSALGFFGVASVERVAHLLPAVGPATIASALIRIKAPPKLSSGLDCIVAPIRPPAFRWF